MLIRPSLGQHNNHIWHHAGVAQTKHYMPMKHLEGRKLLQWVLESYIATEYMPYMEPNRPPPLKTGFANDDIFPLPTFYVDR